MSGGGRAYKLRIVIVLGHLIAGYRAYAQGNLPFTEKKTPEIPVGKSNGSCHAIPFGKLQKELN